MVSGRVSSSVQYTGTARSRIPTTHYETKTPPGPSITELLDAWLRLRRLLDAPQDITVLAPLCEREILCCLLQGPQGAIVRQFALADSRLSQVRRALR
ncbi:AraC family transcriptional regulator N-terminal domain-containing protein [Sphingomonas sp. PAMC26645]|uniref:AraC family transcriptional regulator N-terminal domain-containing protein n=1 Tax=Sphingomonas sp. PAMC26645 TaxID=2565555 RepID=UPI001FF9B16A|nr:AraC family transcriptional regulator N-terminal domain-containing protein [Sphingomonas sp. PAMC26645]